jgi:ATP-binding cassette, subfamily A (ABC1), member 3
MAIKKFLYSIRNYILLIIQFIIAPLYVVITMLADNINSNTALPELAISFKEYLETVTTVEKGNFTNGSIAEQIFTSYQDMFKNLSNTKAQKLHTLTITNNNFEDEILNQYNISKAITNLKYMVGVSIKEDNITAWFNNQAFHTAPLSINLINNAILR